MQPTVSVACVGFSDAKGRWPSGERELGVRYVRDRFITVAKTEDDFPFQLYLRLYQDDVMYEMVNPKDSTWLCAMVLHAAEAPFVGSS